MRRERNERDRTVAYPLLTQKDADESARLQALVQGGGYDRCRLYEIKFPYPNTVLRVGVREGGFLTNGSTMFYTPQQPTPWPQQIAEDVRKWWKGLWR